MWAAEVRYGTSEGPVSVVAAAGALAHQALVGTPSGELSASWL